MSGAEQNATEARQDRIQAALAAFATASRPALDEAATEQARHVLIDAMAVALGALDHEAAVAARRYAHLHRAGSGATVWGTGDVVTAEAAALVNGVPLRGYDYNDLYIGRCGGHPSDIIPGLFALAEWRGVSGALLLDAIATGYDVTIALMDSIDLKACGWDYPVITAIGATCAACRVLGLDESRAREALAIVTTSNYASLEPESGDLNTRGNLTMWKRLNGAYATRNAVYATLLAEAGVEGVVRPFSGRFGFWAKTASTAEDEDALLARLSASRPGESMAKVTFKRWPVGSRAQSAIQAALDARSQLGERAGIAAAMVETDESVYAHLVGTRPMAWTPRSRETADHSLPYIVAAALLDGGISVASFDAEKVLQPERQAFMRECLRVEVAADLCRGAKAGFLSRVTLTDAAGRRVTGIARPPPGHPAHPFSPDDFRQKFREVVEPFFGASHTNELWTLLGRVERLDSVAELAHRLVFSTTH